jgi:hypothetical protein
MSQRILKRRHADAAPVSPSPRHHAAIVLLCWLGQRRWFDRGRGEGAWERSNLLGLAVRSYKLRPTGQNGPMATFGL